MDATQPTTRDLPGMARPDLLCFSHLRWDFVFQRPQHLLTRALATMRVLFWEEPVWTDEARPRLDTITSSEGVVVLRPYVPHGFEEEGSLRGLLDGMLHDLRVTDPVLWFYTPNALPFTEHLSGSMTVYDCMDELSAFAGADPTLPLREQALLRRADLVFTGGHSLFEVKARQHPRVYAFPSGVEVAHFEPARAALPDPVDQAALPHPRAGFYGVIDERLDYALLAAVADLRPGVQFVLVGPTAKVDEADLPRRPNLHYLGGRQYSELPAYVANWQVALMPFAINATTRFISPTKTPEYLAAGLPVVSTPVPDVVRTYGDQPGVTIAATIAAFAEAIDHALALDPATWRPAVDAMLAGQSWDSTWARMRALMHAHAGMTEAAD